MHKLRQVAVLLELRELLQEDVRPVDIRNELGGRRILRMIDVAEADDGPRVDVDLVRAVLPVVVDVRMPRRDSSRPAGIRPRSASDVRATFAERERSWWMGG
jgi:hypothetical protein